MEQARKVSQKKRNRKAKTTDPALVEQRELAKIGMVGSLGGLFVTGFLRSKAARMLHPWLGWALLSFSIWHHMVSKPQKK
jgi:hypothetical protein